MRKKLKILLYGDIDLNFIDGSAIWLTSVAQVLNKDKNINVDFLLKARKQESKLFSEIANLTQVNVINSYESYEDEIYNNKNRMDVTDACKIMQLLDNENEYDCVIVRGFNLTKELIKHPISSKVIPYITEFKHKKEEISTDEHKMLTEIYNHFPNMFVQTPQTKQYLEDILRVDGAKFILMYPMIPDYSNEQPTFKNINNSIVYTGKFAEKWYIEELLDATEKIRSIDSTIEINIAGNKFQGGLIPKKEEISSRLKEQDGVNWFGGLCRQDALKLIHNSDVGYSWRSKDIDNDNSLELSTKLLEYGRLGKPIILRRTKMHEELLGTNYELFVENMDELVNKSIDIMYDRNLYRKVSKKVYEKFKKFTFSEAYKRLSPIIWRFNKQKTKILFAGHDLKFIQMVLDHFNSNDLYEVKIDKWLGHNRHDEQKSKELLKWADIIFCEWGLGNAVWYSQNKEPSQKLYIRMHQQERFTQYFKEFNFNNIDKIITISPYFFEEFHKVCGIPREKMVMIYNMIDTKDFDVAKKLSSEELRFNIGICGIIPRMKRLDKALDILENLWTKDNRYRLFIKGKLPKELPWIMNRLEEKEYYNKVFNRIKVAPWKNNVIFDPQGGDMKEWFRKIGYILSTSDFESFHLAPMEGMASGSIPLILHWPGAETIYPNQYIFNEESEIVNYILNNEYSNNTDLMKSYPSEHFDINHIIKVYEELLKVNNNC